MCLDAITCISDIRDPSQESLLIDPLPWGLEPPRVFSPGDPLSLESLHRTLSALSADRREWAVEQRPHSGSWQQAVAAHLVGSHATILTHDDIDHLRASGVT